MSKSWNRTETWLALIVVAVGLLLTAIVGLWMYMSATATPLHPNAQDVPSVTDSDPSRQWADAVEQGRQIVRAGSHRAEPAWTFGGGRCRWRDRVGRRLWLGGSRETGARRARNAVQDRHRLHGAHLGRGRPAVGERTG